MNTKKYIVSIFVLAAVIILANYVYQPPVAAPEDTTIPAIHQVPPAQPVSLDGVSFERPAELMFTNQADGSIDIDFPYDVQDKVAFRGKIVAYSSYEAYRGGGGYLPNYVKTGDKAGQWLTGKENFDELVSLAGSKTAQGKDLVVLSAGDAGGLTMYYLIRSDTKLVIVKMNTDTMIDTTLTPEANERLMTQQVQQSQLLDRLFNQISKSVRFTE